MTTHATAAGVPPVFNLASARAAGDAVKKALAALNIGYELEIGRGSFSGSELSLQLKVRLPGGHNPEQALFLQMCKTHGFDPAAKLRSAGYGNFTLTSYHPRRPKYPWTVTLESGVQYKFTTEAVKDAFARMNS
ncbi:hypothetical protein [Pseudomonas mosselii]|uniref:hypothetical protein n=1 Tax=Pseudomonas mosselii TaxID=78327 RepID=UPI0021DAE8F9|nr:hypothetical protein [Pseudomonas mosselii]MCU9528344.1 hypothetical protein [Pseudomonas mosselii]MCU9535517.1 hypothetical protein [Pseudomonas mosselii]MCU9543423.1 hypothetical protein [Pseudomonas mosselii]MCU9547368.1 hypothetical protein [Pseudomonas mosselii]